MLTVSGLAAAAPVTYSAFAFASGSLGSWTFTDAQVVFTYKSDTGNVQFIQVPVDPSHPEYGVAEAYINTSGVASVTIVSKGKTRRATFAPGQIFVSLDLGNAGSDSLGGRGVGFGSFSPTAPGGIEPAYPLGIEDGTIDWGDGAIPSAGVQALSLDLQHDTAFSGRAWSCVGFPDTTCPQPTLALSTDKGDFYMTIPYYSTYWSDVLEPGFFTASVFRSRSSGSSTSAPAASFSQLSTSTSSKPIRYSGYVISDVKIGPRQFTAAQVKITFDADASTVTPLSDPGSSGYVNSIGRAHVFVTKGNKVVSADFAPDQIYVYFNKANGSIGFGSYAGGYGYPLSIGPREDNPGLTENSTVGAITDIINTPADIVNYTANVANLVTDLTNTTHLGGAASSCVSLVPVTWVCQNLTPLALSTTAGDLYLYEPYTDDETTTDGSQPFSINWGAFWTDTNLGD